MVQIGDGLAAGKKTVGGYDLSCVDLDGFNKDEWDILRSHIVYAHAKYPRYGLFGVQVVPVSSFNVPLWPGISLDEESFMGDDESAIHVLVHEPMHNLMREGIYHDFPYFNGVTISDVVGPYSQSNYMSRFITLLQKSKCSNGKSLWHQAKDQANNSNRK